MGQSETQTSFPVLKEVVGRRRRDTPLEHYKHCLLKKKPPLVLICCESKIAIKVKWKQMDK